MEHCSASWAVGYIRERSRRARLASSSNDAGTGLPYSDNVHYRTCYLLAGSSQETSHQDSDNRKTEVLLWGKNETPAG